MWKIDLTEDQKKKTKDVYFNQAWKKFSEDGNLNLKDSYRFLKDLMTMPLLPHDQQLQTEEDVSPGDSANQMTDTDHAGSEEDQPQSPGEDQFHQTLDQNMVLNGEQSMKKFEQKNQWQARIDAESEKKRYAKSVIREHLQEMINK